ncbi:MAG TPA: class I SAM-dependent methyltransferase [Vicinamibacterales bacterium]|jgi:SAM-dependent methyltransferase
MPEAGDGVPGFEAAFFDRVDQAEREHFWFQGRMALIEHVLNRFFPRAETFLDVGSGTGHVVAALRRQRPSMRVTAAEAFSDGLRMTAKRATGVELIQTDALHLPYDAEFDVVGAFDVIEHIADDGVAVREMVRAVRPDGGLIFTVPQHRFLWSPFDDYVHHHRRYSRPEMRRLLESAGCDVVFVTSFVSLLLPAMFLARMVRRAHRDDPLSEFHVSGWMNRLGRSLLTMERWLIGRGMTFPAGGSLLVVARKRSE